MSRAFFGRAFIAGLLLLLTSSVLSAELVKGPIRATVLRTIDGDTIEIKAQVWPLMYAIEPSRIRGVNAPEIHGRCLAEKVAALDASAFVAALISQSTDRDGDRPVVLLSDIERDKFGRILATITVPSASGPIDLSERLIGAGHARPYHGEKRLSWCGR